jgi:hypothetical protein
MKATVGCVGNSGKTCYPRNVGFAEIHKISFQGDWIHEYLKSWTCEDLESWICEAPKSRTCEDLESWICEAPKSRTCEDLGSWTCEALKSRICEDTKSWTGETPESGIYEVWESTEVQIQRLWHMKISMNKRLMNHSKRPSQRRYLKSPGLMCELVADL